MPRLALPERAVIIAMDHARTLGVVPGLEDPGRTIDAVLAGGADAVMTSYGVIKHYRDKLIGRVHTFLRLDGGPSNTREDWLRYTEWHLLHTVEDARRLGVDGVCVMGFLGGAVEMTTYGIVARVVGDCAHDGLPVMVEALPCLDVPRIPEPTGAAAMAAASRIAFELGADIVKTYYTGTVESFRQVTAACPVPCLIAGGVRMDSLEAALNVVHGAMTGGAKGVVFGRNIWQDRDPARAVRAMRAIVCQGATVADALAA
jgi:fructose-bisphosphate aldolase, class I